MSEEEKKVQKFLEMDDTEFKKEWKDLPEADKTFIILAVEKELS
jgi:hypothetical protein